MTLKSTEQNRSKKRTFDAVLERHDAKLDATHVSVPFDVEKIYGTKGQVKVKAWFDGQPYRGVLANMGTGCHIIIVRKDIRNAIGKVAGESIKVELELDLEARVVNIPLDLENAFSKSRLAKNFFDTLSYTNRKEYVVWITSAKKNETRARRVETSIQKLLAGMKNPSHK
jgi:hypothetical protein